MIDFLRNFIEGQDQKWAESWGILEGHREAAMMDIEIERGDQEILERLMEILIGIGRRDDVNGFPSQRASTIFLGIPEEVIGKVVQELSTETLIVLRNRDIPKNVQELCADRAWRELPETNASLCGLRDRFLKIENKNQDLTVLVQEKTVTITELSKALDDDEKLIVDSSFSEIMSELESRGYIQAKRRPCNLCSDTQEHTLYVGEVDQMNDPANVEGLCPLVKPGQRCLQCTLTPPHCFSNESLMVCKQVEETPCDQSNQNLACGSLTGKKKHTRKIHSLDKGEDAAFIKKLKGKYGTCILSEYESDEDTVKW